MPGRGLRPVNIVVESMPGADVLCLRWFSTLVIYGQRSVAPTLVLASR